MTSDLLFSELAQLAPESWARPQMRRIGCIKNGGTPTADPENWDGDLPFVTPPDLRDKAGEAVCTTFRHLTDEGARGSSTADYGVIMSIRAPIGYVARIARRSAFNQGCRVVIPGPDYCDRFIAYCLIAANPIAVALGQGTTFMELSGESFAAIRVPAPPVEEQRRIADYLDHETNRIDQFIGTQRALIERLQGRRADCITEIAFGLAHWDGASRPSNTPGKPHLAIEPLISRRPPSWGIARFRVVFDRIEKRNEDQSEETCSLLSTGDLVPRSTLANPQDADPNYLPRYLIVVPGDLVVNPMWMTGGAIGVATRSGAVSPDYRVFRPRDVSPRFVHYVLRSRPYFDQYLLYTRANTTFDRRVQQDVLDTAPIPIPPLAEQEAIVKELDEQTAKIDALITKAERSIELSQERRAALITAAVTGQIDVATGKQRVLEESL